MINKTVYIIMSTEQGIFLNSIIIMSRASPPLAQDTASFTLAAAPEALMRHDGLLETLGLRAQLLPCISGGVPDGGGGRLAALHQGVDGTLDVAGRWRRAHLMRVGAHGRCTVP